MSLYNEIVVDNSRSVRCGNIIVIICTTVISDMYDTRDVIRVLIRTQGNDLLKNYINGLTTG